jgi:hypothetical protein
MSKLTEIFQMVEDYQEERVYETRDFFSKPLSRRKAYSEVLGFIDNFERWMTTITDDKGRYSLTNGDYSVDFLALDESVSNGTIKKLYGESRVIRSEILMAATKEEFEEMKKLQTFWEGIECSLMMLAKS